MVYCRKFMEGSLEHLLSRHGGVITRRLVDLAGIEPHVLTNWVREGRLERIQRGVYRLPDAPLQSHEDFLEVSLRIPYAVICLRSALAFYGLTTYIPKAVDIAVPRTSKPPRLEYPPIQVHYLSPRPYSYGTEQIKIADHPIQIYSMEKTLVDLLRYSNTYGDELFAEGLKNYIARTKPRPDYNKLLETARVLRVEKRLKPILRVAAYDLST